MHLEKSCLLYVFVVLAIAQTAFANIYTQLQFIKITSPQNGQDVKAGEELVIKYVMQPLIDEQTSMGKALSLDVNFHRRTGDQKEQMISYIHKSCPVAAKANKYMTYTKKWTVPADIQTGSYAVDFVEAVQLRRTQITSTETININVVD